MQMPPDTEQDEDERSETENAAEQAEMREHMARLQLGREPQPALQSPKSEWEVRREVATAAPQPLAQRLLTDVSP